MKWWQGVYQNADKNAPKASGAIIEGIAGTFFSQKRVEGFHRVDDAYPGVKVLGKPIAADWNREKGVRATEAFLSRYRPAQLNFIWAASNEMGLGAMLTAERRSMLGTTPADTGKVAIFTNDVTPESADAIRAGKIIAETHHGFEWGWFGTKTAVQLACEQQPPPAGETLFAAAYRAEDAHLVAVVRGAEEPRTSLADGLYAVLAANRSMAEQRRVTLSEVTSK